VSVWRARRERSGRPARTPRETCMKIGVAYYPEYWPQERWPQDARMMREMGIDVVRVGEFAWSRLEPRRLVYDMEWLGRALDVLAAEGLAVILCTPTAAPPSWLFDRHPSMVPVDFEGKLYYRGSRRDACLNNRPYRRYVRRIVRELARSFGGRPEIMAWQIDNELGAHASGRCYCDYCEQAFREWLKRRYGTIDRLNRLWGTEFWSQTVNDWHYIPVPRRTPGGPHPSLALDYERFTAATVRDFTVEQRELIDEYCPSPRPTITTNCMGLSADQVNLFALGTVVDVAAYDNYPVSPERLERTALQLDLTRSTKRRPFWVLEQQTGPTLIDSTYGQPRPGQLRLWSYQAAARGAELLCYFRWRTCATGQEMHWYGILDADGTAGRRAQELAETIAGLKRAAPEWEGRTPDARVALALDYDCLWALRWDSMAARLDYQAQLTALYGSLRRRGHVVDLVSGRDAPQECYGVVVAPMPDVVRDQMAAHWHRFVSAGGRLLVTAPVGYRTEQNAWSPEPPPGPLRPLLGVTVTEHDTLGPGAESRVALGSDTYPVQHLCTRVQTDAAETLAIYQSHFYEGTPALTRHQVGSGAAYYLGALSTEELYDRVVGLVLDDAGLAPDPWSDELVEAVALRSSGASGRRFVLNHGAEAVELALPDGSARTDLLTGAQHSGSVPLPPYGVVLLDG
jgi:beta-galactosidase